MKSLSACASTGFEWKQPRSGQRYWELVSEGELLATLAFEKAFNSLATLVTADGEWQMRRDRGITFDVLIFDATYEEPIGRYHQHWTGKDGVLLMQNQREYTWTATNFWNTRYEIRDTTSNSVLVRYTRGLNRDGIGDIFKMQAMMEIPGPMLRDAELAMLSGWGFYQAVLLREQALFMGKNKLMMYAAPGAPSKRARTDDR